MAGAGGVEEDGTLSSEMIHRYGEDRKAQCLKVRGTETSRTHQAIGLQVAVFRQDIGYSSADWITGT